MYKKVTGERLVAAIVDSIILSILSGIPTAIYMFKDGFESFIDSISTQIVDTSSNGNIFGNEFLIFTSILGLVLSYIYFVYIPYKWHGQTLGKKMMSIKAIDEFGNNLSLWGHTLRGIQVWSAYVSVLVLPLLFVDYMTFSLALSLLSGGVSILFFVSLIMLLAKDDGRGIHDSLAGSYVVKTNIDLNQHFVEKTTKMGDWADVEFSTETELDKDKKDDWYE